MRSFDFTPLYRSTVGFDRLFDLLDAAAKGDAGAGYPPYNIERVDNDRYRISVAAAGFSDDDLSVEVREDVLVVKGERQEQGDDKAFLHQGIAGRSFERRFQLAEHVKVTGADLHNGLLNIDLEREIPEAKKPRRIEIKAPSKKASFLKAPSAA